MRRELPALIVFAKAPICGAVKTRLAREIGVVAATAWYRRALSRTETMLKEAGLGAVFNVAPSADVFRRTSSLAVRSFTQVPGDLGRRMALAAKAASGPSIIFGVDIPGLTPAILRRARDAVLRHDLILGPARDGGFYLVGVRTPAHAFRLYDGVRWSSEHALADTLRNVSKHWRVARLPVLNDVDEAADLEASGYQPRAVAA